MMAAGSNKVFLNLKAALVDLSGTLHVEDRVISGVVDALRRLKGSKIAVRFVTNTSKESRASILDRLRNFGLDINNEELFTSLTATRRYVEKRCLRPLLLLEPSALQDFDGVNCNEPNAVVVGLAPSCFSYESMNTAFRLLLDGASLVAVHKGRYYKRKDGMAIGPGPFVACLEHATSTQAQVVGKPEAAFFAEALEALNVTPQQAIMIGDDVIDDVEGAMKIGMMGALVKTGKYRAGDEDKISPAPDFVFDSFPDAVDQILNCDV